jgi:class 3 adenylate cyclase
MKLMESEEFQQRFEEQDHCEAVVMAADIRRSTELMLKARDPQLFAQFVMELCLKLQFIITQNYGVFDKFTGDGILAFFPKFYSGEDAAYYAVRAAHDSHDCFSTHYRNSRNCFKSVIIDVGLGIGIDFGLVHLVKMQDGYTAIGEPVVYACRLSSAEAGQTLLNQPAYEMTSSKFVDYMDFKECEVDIKHEGRLLAYAAKIRQKSKKYEPALPDWVEPPPAGSKSS